MKRIFLCLILCLCSVLLITACGGDDEEEESQNTVCTSNDDCKLGKVCNTETGKCVKKDEFSDEENKNDSEADSGDSTADNDSSDSGEEEEEEEEDYDTFCKPEKLLRCDPEDFNKIIRCNRSGSAEESVKCGEGSVCNDDKCIQQECRPGQPVCSSTDYSKVFKCSEKGLFSEEGAEDCGKGVCDNGECISLCKQAAAEHSYQGCNFYTTVFMYTQRTDPIFALTVSNSSTTHAVNVSITVSSADGEADAGANYFCIDNDSAENCTSQTSASSLSVEPGKLGIIMFPHDRNIAGTGLKWNSLHIKTDLPVTIYQFSPIDNSTKNPFESSGISVGGDSTSGKSYSNDASLLIPTTSVYTDYVVSSHYSYFIPPSYTSGTHSTSYATIIGSNDSDTVINIKPTVAITASNGIPAIAANTEGTITLKKGQVAQIEAKASDLSGTRIYCDASKADCHPFVVFSGVDCLTIPESYGYCDHIEQQLFPVQTWGKKYILVKSKERGEEWDLVRIYASKDGTKLTFKPATPEKIAVPENWRDFTVKDVKTELNAGEYSEFYFKGTLTVEANNQIMVAQYLTGSEMISLNCQTLHGNLCVGDPAMMLIPPAEQFRKDYLFLTPGSYQANYATIVMTTGEDPTLDGSFVPDIKKIEGTDFSYAVVWLGNAFRNHTLTCEKNPCGLFVYGWERDVSYAYPGGLNFEKLSTN